jgi:hypothetical protein
MKAHRGRRTVLPSQMVLLNKKWKRDLKSSLTDGPAIQQRCLALLHRRLQERVCKFDCQWLVYHVYFQYEIKVFTPLRLHGHLQQQSRILQPWSFEHVDYCGKLVLYLSTELHLIRTLTTVLTRASLLHISLYFLCFLELVRGFLPHSWDIRRTEQKLRVLSFITRPVTQQTFSKRGRERKVAETKLRKTERKKERKNIIITILRCVIPVVLSWYSKMCICFHIRAVKTQQTICQLVSLCIIQHYVIYIYMFRPCKRAIIRLFLEPVIGLYKRSMVGRDLVLHRILWGYIQIIKSLGSIPLCLINHYRPCASKQLSSYTKKSTK